MKDKCIMKDMKDFAQLAKTFGAVDPETSKFRAECRKAGFAFVSHSSMSRAQALAVMNSPETQQIVAQNK